MDLLTEIVVGLPMQVPWLPGGGGGQDPVMPSGNNGFASRILGGILGLGVLVLAMIWISKKPKNRR